MNLKELIAALTKLETVSGGDTETECMAVGLSIKTVVAYKQSTYGYRDPEQERKTQNMITISSLPLNQPYTPAAYDATDHVSRIP